MLDAMCLVLVGCTHSVEAASASGSEGLGSKVLHDSHASIIFVFAPLVRGQHSDG